MSCEDTGVGEEYNCGEAQGQGTCTGLEGGEIWDCGFEKERCGCRTGGWRGCGERAEDRWVGIREVFTPEHFLRGCSESVGGV